MLGVPCRVSHGRWKKARESHDGSMTYAGLNYIVKVATGHSDSDKS